MPITVRHDVPGAGGAVGLAALVSGMTDERRNQEQRGLQYDQLNQQRAMHDADIQSRFQLQQRASKDAYDRTLLAHGYDRELRAEEFERKLTETREAGRAAADSWKTEYTAKQKQQFATEQHALDEARSSGRFGDDELRQLEQMVTAKRLGAPMSWKPKTDEEKRIEELKAAGKGPGDVWMENGNQMTMEPSGRVVTQVSFDKSEAGIKAKLDAQTQKEMIKAESDARKEGLAIQRELRQAKLDLLKEEVQQVDYVDGKAKISYRRRNSTEINQILSGIYGDLIPSPGGAAVPPPAGGAAYQAIEAWIARGGEVVRTGDDAAYAELQPGAEFMDENGNVYRKPRPL